MKSLKSIDYGVVLMTSLKPTFTSREFVDIRTIAKAHKLPYSFLEKLAQRFKRAGIFESRRGAGGGYRLIKNPETFSIETVIAVLENQYQYCPINRYLAIKSPSTK